MTPFAPVGNILYALNLINIVGYGTSLYLYGNDPSHGIFDTEWLKDGFCLPHEDRDFLTTHDLSGYAMILLALFGLGVQHILSQSASKYDSNQMNRAESRSYWALLGALGHAAGHFLISTGKRNHYYPPADMRFIDDLRESSFLVALGKAGPGYPLFWIPLVKTYMMNTARGKVALVAIFLHMGSLFMPAKFGFAYTQAVLFGGMSLDQLLLPPTEKQTFEYALWPLLTVIPNGIFAWIECLTCTSSITMKSHGHMIYDVYMVSSYTLFYLVCWVKEMSWKPKVKVL